MTDSVNRYLSYFGRHPLEVLYDKFTRKIDQGSSLRIGAEDLDWLVVSGAYSTLVNAALKQRFATARARLEARGEDLSFLLPMPNDELPNDEPAGNTAPNDAQAPMPDVMTPKMLADRWGVSVTSIYKKLKSGEIEHFKLGDQLFRVTRDVVQRIEGAEPR